MADLNEVKSLVEKQGTAWEEFKKTNDARLAELEKKGYADPLIENKLEKINEALDEAKSRINKIETQAPASGDEEKGADKNEIEYKNAFMAYVRKGREIPSDFEQKALSVQSDPDGGYLVTPQMSNNIIKKVFETSPMRQVASVQTISTDTLDIIVDNDEASSAWTSETGTVSDTDTPTIGKKSIPVHEQYAQPKPTQKLLDDAFLDVEAWLAEKVGDIMSRTENTAFFTGNGVTKPRGILTYDAGTSWGQVEQISSTSSSAGTLAADDFSELYYGVKTEYQRNSTFLMNRLTLKKARQLKESSTNQYIWIPGLQAGDDGMIYGRPIIQCDDMPVIATNSLSVAFGDFARAYQIVDRTGIRMLRDPFTNKPFVKFYTTKRVGGDVANFEAFKLLKMDA